MNFLELQKAGCFVDTKPVKKHIVWEKSKTNTQEFDVFVVRQQAGAVVESIASDDKSQMIEMVKNSIRLGEKGDEAFTYDQVYSLKPDLFWLLVDAVNEVNQKN